MCESAKDSRSHSKLVKAKQGRKIHLTTLNKSVVLNIMVFLLLYLLKGMQLLLSRSQKSQHRPNGAYYSE